jgi:hypothetical protein
VSVYKHPGANKKQLFVDLMLFLQASYSLEFIRLNKFMLIGDFNIDFNKKPSFLKNPLFEEIKFVSALSNNNTFFSSNNIGSQLDWCFTNINSQEIFCMSYPTWYAEHSAIYVNYNFQ